MEITRSVLCLLPETEIEGLEAFRQKHIHHPGRAVPFHITLLYNFFFPDDMDNDVLASLKGIAEKTPRFEFSAKPLSSFPTTRVLYLTPTPATPIETLVSELQRAFPQFHNPKYGMPVFHMTLALGYSEQERDNIIEEYFQQFGKGPLKLRAGSLGIFVEQNGQWKLFMSLPIG